MRPTEVHEGARLEFAKHTTSNITLSFCLWRGAGTQPQSSFVLLHVLLYIFGSLDTAHRCLPREFQNTCNNRTRNRDCSFPADGLPGARESCPMSATLRHESPGVTPTGRRRQGSTGTATAVGEDTRDKLAVVMHATAVMAHPVGLKTALCLAAACLRSSK